MHPAASIILFTTSSGAGYGLLFLMGLTGPLGLLPADRWLGFTGLAIALGLVTLGLLVSTLHLGHPERAWRAMSQWRSSWLSREGVAALATYVPAILFSFGWIFLQSTGGLWALFGLLASLGAVVTVFCTAKIYASLKTIRQWNHRLAVPIYLAFSLATGALWLNALTHIFLLDQAWSDALLLLALTLAWGLKFRYWMQIEQDESDSTPESATALGNFGRVRVLDPPHTEANYLMREMGFRVARKHALILRLLALLFGFAVPFFMAAIALLWISAAAAIPAVLAALSGSLGVVIERWLFFAEAKHTVMLYYGESSA